MLSPIQLSPNMDIPTLVSAVNNNFHQIESENRSQVIRDEDGVNRIIIGRDADGQYVMKVSQKGVDVLTAKGNQLIFNSNQNIFKVTKTGTVTHTLSLNSEGGVPSGTQTLTIPHNLGYKPAFQVFMETTPGYATGQNLFQLPEMYPVSGSVFTLFKARVDLTNLYVEFYHRSITFYDPYSPTFKIKYYLYEESAV